MRIWIRVLSKRSFLVHCEKFRVLFNAPEESLRSIQNLGIRLGRLSHVFFSRRKWDSIAGLAGILMEINEIPRIFQLSLVNFPPKIDFQRLAVSLNQDEIADSTHGTGTQTDLFGCFKVSQIAVKDVVFFVLEFFERKKFNVAAAKNLGIPKGPLYGILLHNQGKLSRGESIEFNGQTVRPNQVMEVSRPAQRWLVADCPDSSYIPYLPAKAACGSIDYIIHMTSTQDYWNPLYRAWIKDNFPLAKNLRTCDSSEVVLFPKVLERSKEFHNLCPEVFPVLKSSHVPEKDRSDLLHHGSIVHVEPEYSLSHELGSVSPQIDQSPDMEVLHGDYVIPLGTSSSGPTRYRNGTLTPAITLVSSYLVTSKQYTYMLDCGEATLFQMLRYLGEYTVHAILAKLKFIFISHVHADHHLGFISLLKGWIRIRGSGNQKLAVIAPLNVWEWILEYNKIEAARLDCVEYYPSHKDIPRDLAESVDAEQIVAVPVKHCKYSCGLVVQHTQGKIVYSGDCRPSKKLAEKGIGARLLIHEATFEDDLEAEARAKNHSTVGDAKRIAREMNAETLLISHFSQRYTQTVQYMGSTKGNDQGTPATSRGLAGEPITSENEFKGNIIAAQDGMRINLDKARDIADKLNASIGQIREIEATKDPVDHSQDD